MSVYYMFNKPKGCVTARRDVNKTCVMDYFPEEMRDLLHPIGRLDLDTEGLLIVTDDGMLDNRIMQPGHHIEKEYYFKALGDITQEKAEALCSGIKLYHNEHISCNATYREAGKSTVIENFNDIPPVFRPKWLKNPQGTVTSGYLTITEGKKHQIKLMIKAVGCRVFYLKRIRLGNLLLDENLKAGEYRELSGDEPDLLVGNRL